MYRDKLVEFKKEKGISTKEWAELSGVHADTIKHIIRPDNPDKDSAKVTTLEALCKPLDHEVWELFYTGNTSLVSLQAEVDRLNAEREALIAENAILKAKNDTLLVRLDTLKDQLISFLMKGK